MTDDRSAQPCTGVARAARPHASGIYVPRPHQIDIHARSDRFKVLVCHRRFGKTVMCINELIDRAAQPKHAHARFAYIAPSYRQAKRVVWDYLKRYAIAVETIAEPDVAAAGKRPMARALETELRVDFANGSRIQLFGADDPDSLRGLYLDGVVFDEYGQMRPKVWTEVVRPMLADREGFAIFIGTPKGQNAFFDIYERAKSDREWFHVVHKASATGIVPAHELDAARRDMSKEEYEQEFECSFTAAIVGAYFARELADAEAQGRIGNIPYDPRHRVYTAWDLGYNDPTVIWFIQIVGQEIRWFDYYANRGAGLDHYASVVNARGYDYAGHYLPHDVAHHEVGSGRTRVDFLRGHDLEVRAVPSLPIEDGIEALRGVLARSWFDGTKCREGLNALRHYRSEWNERREVFVKQPLHDWASHAADAARTFALAFDDRRRSSSQRHEETAESGYDMSRN
jgi:hypothetical protein